MWTGYVPKLLYQLEATYMALLLASPYVLSLICFVLEVEKDQSGKALSKHGGGHLHTQVHMQRHRAGPGCYVKMFVVVQYQQKTLIGSVLGMSHRSSWQHHLVPLGLGRNLHRDERESVVATHAGYPCQLKTAPLEAARCFAGSGAARRCCRLHQRPSSAWPSRLPTFEYEQCAS